MNISTLPEAVRRLVEPLGWTAGGEWHTEADGVIDVIDPATEAVIAHVPRCGAEQVDAAVRAARVAFDDGPWARMRPASASA